MAELGAGFLSNEAGILDSVRFENSTAYLGSWIQKLKTIRGIISAASQAQRASDFIMGNEHKESLQECQISPEGMPLTWARSTGSTPGIPASPTKTRTATGYQRSWNGSTEPGRSTGFPDREGNLCRYERPESYPAHLGASA